MIDTLPFLIYIHLNNHQLALDERTVTGVAEAMRIKKDRASDCLKKMIAKGQIWAESVGSTNVYWVKQP